jgi:hypothetical protein
MRGYYLARDVQRFSLLHVLLHLSSFRLNAYYTTAENQ